LRAYLKDEAGASAAEYALLLGVIGAAVAVALFMLGSSIASQFGATAEVLDSPDGQLASSQGGGSSGGSSSGGTGGGSGGGGSNQGWHGAGHGGGRGQGAGGGRGNNP
jgi:Flp pilus assembly pilin Flp